MVDKIINIAIADDHTLFRKTLKDFLSQQASFTITIEADNTSDLLQKIKVNPPDILIIDLFMPDGDIAEALKLIRNENLHIKIIVLSMSRNLVLINQLTDIGIHAYISKSDEPRSLIEAIHSTYEGKIYRTKLFTDSLYLNNQVNLKKDQKNNHIHFDEREKKVLQLLWEEKSNKDIANEIFLSVRSIEKIRQDMKEKLGIKSTIGLLKYALNNHIITTENMYATYLMANENYYPMHES